MLQPTKIYWGGSHAGATERIGPSICQGCRVKENPIRLEWASSLRADGLPHQITDRAVKTIEASGQIWVAYPDRKIAKQLEELHLQSTWPDTLKFAGVVYQQRGQGVLMQVLRTE